MDRYVGYIDRQIGDWRDVQKDRYGWMDNKKIDEKMHG